MANWNIEKDKNGLWHLREDDQGRFSSRKDAFKEAEHRAMVDKTILRVHGKDAGYETFDFTNILSPQEWETKANSDYMVAKAEYLISKNKYAESRNDVYWATILHKTGTPDFQAKKAKMADNKLRKQRDYLAFKEAKRRLRESKRNSD